MLQDLETDRGLMQVSLGAHKQKVADLETAARECSMTHHHALQVCTLPSHDGVHCVLQMHRASSHTSEYITPFSSICGLSFSCNNALICVSWVHTWGHGSAL